MAHLIQPLDIEGTLYCVMYHGGRATRGVATSIQSTPTAAPDVTDADSPWIAHPNSTITSTEITFGIGCGNELALSFDTAGTGNGNHTIVIDVYVNGGSVSSTSIPAFSTTGTATIGLTDYPCGNLITLVITLYASAGALEADPPLHLAIAITSIT